MEMIPNKGYYVGRFNEKDIRAGLEEKAKEETGLNYTNQEIVYKNQKPIAIKLYVCDLEHMLL